MLVPAGVVASLGGMGRIPVRVTFDGIAYQGSVVSMGAEEKILGIPKAIRAQLGKAIGDVVHVRLELDRSERSVAVPDDLRVALEAAGIAEAFGALSYSHQREYITWIGGAKKADTRVRRVAGTVDRLRG